VEDEKSCKESTSAGASCSKAVAHNKLSSVTEITAPLPAVWNVHCAKQVAVVSFPSKSSAFCRLSFETCIREPFPILSYVDGLRVGVGTGGLVGGGFVGLDSEASVVFSNGVLVCGAFVTIAVGLAVELKVGPADGLRGVGTGRLIGGG
jgi:hypothetical protein